MGRMGRMGVMTGTGHPTPGTRAGQMEALPHWMVAGILFDAIGPIDAR